MSGLLMLWKMNRDVPRILIFLGHDGLIAFAEILAHVVAASRRSVHAQMPVHGPSVEKSTATAELIPSMGIIAARTYFITHSSIESEAW